MKMRNKNGFSVIELAVVIGVTAILSAIGIPAFLQWHNEAKLKDAVSTLRGDLEMAKLTAMRENEFVTVFFNSDNYMMFVDDGAGASGVAENWIPDGEEKVLRNRWMPEGVGIDLNNTTFLNKKTRFNGRGQIANLGIVTIVNTGGGQRTIDLNNRFGRITIN